MNRSKSPWGGSRNLQRLVALRQAEQGWQGSNDLLWLICCNVKQLRQVLAAVLRDRRPSIDGMQVLSMCKQPCMHTCWLARREALWKSPAPA